MAEEATGHFHECIIAFITTDIRLGKWHWLSTWDEFHYQYRCPSHHDWSSMELKMEFQNVILPTIFNYDLNYEQRQKIMMLQTYQVCGPRLQRNSDGYTAVPIEKDIDVELRRRIKDNTNFVTAVTKDINHIATTILNPKEFDEIKSASDGNMPVRKCVSLLLQDDSERIYESLLSWPEIHRRWKGRQTVAKSDDIMKEACFFEKLQEGSKKHFQKKMNQCLLEKMERQMALAEVRRQPRNYEPIPSTSQGHGVRGRRPLYFT